MPVIRFGLLGCASIALRRTLPALRAAQGAELVAVASRDPARAERVAAEYGAEAVADYVALLARPDVDAVYIPLPTGMHHAWTARALAAGKHVLAEKPLAARYADAAELVSLAEARGLVLMENLTFHRHQVHQQVRRLVDDGRIGELRVFQGEFAFPPLAGSDIRYRRELGGGALLDAGVYPLRAARMFLGEDLDVVGASLAESPGHGVDVNGGVLLSAPGGRTAHLSFGFQHAYHCSYTLWGSEGRLTVDRAFTPPPDFAPPIRLERADGTTEFAGAADDQFRATLDAFVRAVADPDEAAASAEEILRQARLVDRVAAVAAASAPNGPNPPVGSAASVVSTRAATRR
ncbi:Gfo/Idh/MocA family protein [Kitasatospora sp. NPDC048239]|uniref:Gfo/Idh/MocA family protein n=1 Tax=Kitasatospora sp. NPDC048239 TaxID=3364046 RepID=UPI003711DFF9